MAASTISQIRYEIVPDLNDIRRLKSLRDLIWRYEGFHSTPSDVPSAVGLAQSGYRALVYEELTDKDELWHIALLFRIGREKKTIWHTVISVDYVLIDPSSRITFTRVSSCIRILSQFALKHLKASCVDMIIMLDNQSNPSLREYLASAMLNEGLEESKTNDSYVKRLRASDDNGHNTVSLPLPNVSRGAVKGLRPMVQKTIRPQKMKSGERVIFIGRVEKNSPQHKSILSFCSKHAEWMSPPIHDRSSYMQTSFNGKGDVRAYVESLVQDAHFIITLDEGKHMTGFLAFIVGYGVPYVSTMGRGGFKNPSDMASPERTVYVPALVCRSLDNGHWTKEGLQQALSLWRMLFTILQANQNKGKFDCVAAMADDGGLNSTMLTALGFSCRAVISNLPWHPRSTAIYSRGTIDAVSDGTGNNAQNKDVGKTRLASSDRAVAKNSSKTGARSGPLVKNKTDTR